MLFRRLYQSFCYVQGIFRLTRRNGTLETKMAIKACSKKFKTEINSIQWINER